MHGINPKSKEWKRYMGDALMAEFVKLDFLPTDAKPQPLSPRDVTPAGWAEGQREGAEL